MQSNPTARPVASGSGLSYTQKISLAAGSLSALYLLPTVAQASIIYGNTPVSLAFNVADGTSVNWDVDGADGADFRLWKAGNFNTGAIFLASRIQTGTGTSTYNGNIYTYPKFGPMNGRGLVGPTFFTDNIQALRKSFVVGPTLANNYVWGKGSTSGYSDRNAMQKTTYGAYAIGYDFNYGFNPGDNYFGFRFLSGADLLYGWATINFDLTGGIVTIKEWAYNDTADTPIHIADTTNAIPEPSTPALTLLGLGAAGLRAWRARKRARAEEALAA